MIKKDVAVAAGVVLVLGAAAGLLVSRIVLTVRAIKRTNDVASVVEKIAAEGVNELINDLRRRQGLQPKEHPTGKVYHTTKGEDGVYRT